MDDWHYKDPFSDNPPPGAWDLIFLALGGAVFLGFLLFLAWYFGG